MFPTDRETTSNAYEYGNNATFCIRPGLSDESISVQAFAGPGFYLALADQDDGDRGEEIRLYKAPLSSSDRTKGFTIDILEGPCTPYQYAVAPQQEYDPSGKKC